MTKLIITLGFILLMVPVNFSQTPSNLISGERHLKNIRQLTTNGENALAMLGISKAANNTGAARLVNENFRRNDILEDP